LTGERENRRSQQEKRRRGVKKTGDEEVRRSAEHLGTPDLLVSCFILLISYPPVEISCSPVLL
jgi:hypothetical protein